MLNIIILSVTAFGLGILHTVLGVDHYIPFAAISKTYDWSRKKTFWVVAGCGTGHCLSTIILCGVCAFFVNALSDYMDHIKDIGEIIGNWALIIFGVVYVIWGIYAAVKNKPHIHKMPNGQTISHYGHDHFPGTKSDGSLELSDEEGHEHPHRHAHEYEHSHHGDAVDKRSNKPVIALFVLFMFTPCEILIPLLLKPPASTSVAVFFIVAGSFTVAHMVTMLTASFLTIKGFNMLPLKKLERYMYIITGGLILLCAAVIITFGL